MSSFCFKNYWNSFWHRFNTSVDDFWLQVVPALINGMPLGILTSDCILCLIPFQMFPYMFDWIEIRGLRKKSITTSTPRSSFLCNYFLLSLEVCLASLSCKTNPWPHSFKPDGIVCLWRMEWYFFLVRISLILYRSSTPLLLKHLQTWILPPPCFTLDFTHSFGILSLLLRLR